MTKFSFFKKKLAPKNKAAQLPKGNFYTDLNSFVYQGMPPLAKDFHPTHEDFPLCCSVLMKIIPAETHRIYFGRSRFDNSVEDYRQYEFILDLDSIVYGQMVLVIKGKSNFFPHQPEFNYNALGNWQIIPLRYDALSNMPNENLWVIYNDLD